MSSDFPSPVIRIALHRLYIGMYTKSRLIAARSSREKKLHDIGVQSAEGASPSLKHLTSKARMEEEVKQEEELQRRARDDEEEGVTSKVEFGCVRCL